MSIFSKKEKEEEKDLEKAKKGSSRKKKKDNNPKAWNKKERMLVIYIFSGTIIISGLLALSARKWKLPGFPQISFSNINLFKSEVIELGGVGANSEQKKLAEDVVENFKKKTGKLSGIYGLFVVDLEDGYYFGVNENETFQAASLIKLPVIVEMYRKGEEGFDLDGLYILKEDDKLGGTGSLQYKKAGYEITYRQLLKKMGEESDNTAYNIIVKTLGEDKMKEKIKEFGMESTSFDENETSPKDIGILFKDLWEGDILSKKGKEELFKILINTGFEKHLPVGIPKDIKISHKVGFEVHVINDAGIVWGQRPYVVVILSKGVIEAEANEIIPGISRDIFEAFTGE